MDLGSAVPAKRNSSNWMMTLREPFVQARSQILFLWSLARLLIKSAIRNFSINFTNMVSEAVLLTGSVLS
ncbi:hypothetical protein DPMN_155992 [Dreissena polymorpha]|uniref:Uncharacterized protein n=1 Tax=Dreissena polymorpha TaxID=45954 RepID=A0A9D4FPV7_DREPO|nr:hypothetical protein DPMN_155992 [Dreissena polymorpha]